LDDDIRELRGKGLSIRQIATRLTEAGTKISPSGVAKVLGAA
jgi:hypothetical protein